MYDNSAESKNTTVFTMETTQRTLRCVDLLINFRRDFLNKYAYQQILVVLAKTSAKVYIKEKNRLNCTKNGLFRSDQTLRRKTNNLKTIYTYTRFHKYEFKLNEYRHYIKYSTHLLTSILKEYLIIFSF